MKFASLFLILVTLSTGALADTAQEQQTIEHLMRHTWERAGSPLNVGPITLEGYHAIAGWTQGKMIKAGGSCYVPATLCLIRPLCTTPV